MSESREDTVYYEDRAEPFAHIFFFWLSDTTEDAVAKFLDAFKTSCRVTKTGAVFRWEGGRHNAGPRSVEPDAKTTEKTGVTS